ncbi:PQQ-binding-like beta-propeller repeat protein [Actinoplanes sp. NPDC000266]
MALIELDLTAQPDEPVPSSPPPAHLYRIPGLILAAVLVLAGGGAAPAMPTLWRYLGSVPAGSGPGSLFRLAGDRAYTVGEAGAGREVTSWSLSEPPRKEWSTRYELPGADPEKIGYGGSSVRPAGDVVLVSDGPMTTVLDRHSGQARWSTSAPVSLMAGGRLGVIEEPRFRAGTVYDQEAGEPGQLFFTADGEPHVEPPTRTDIRGVDLYTGAAVWTLSVPGSVILDPSSGDAPTVLLLSSGGLKRVDGRTGQVLRQAAPAKVDGRAPASGESVGGVMMLYYYNANGYITHEAAYSTGTLARLWGRDVPEILVQQSFCAGVICSISETGLEALDPATGRPAWRVEPNHDLIRRGGYVLEQQSNTNVPVRLVDPPTGTARVDLAGWRAVVDGPADGPVLLRRGLERGASALGVVDPERDAVQPLGVTGAPISDCVSGTGHVACRTDESLRIWAYRG